MKEMLKMMGTLALISGIALSVLACEEPEEQMSCSRDADCAAGQMCVESNTPAIGIAGNGLGAAQPAGVCQSTSEPAGPGSSSASTGRAGSGMSEEGPRTGFTEEDPCVDEFGYNHCETEGGTEGSFEEEECFFYEGEFYCESTDSEGMY